MGNNTIININICILFKEHSNCSNWNDKVSDIFIVNKYAQFLLKHQEFQVRQVRRRNSEEFRNKKKSEMKRGKDGEAEIRAKRITWKDRRDDCRTCAREASRGKRARRVSNVARSLRLRTFSVSLIGSHSMQ